MRLTCLVLAAGAVLPACISDATEGSFSDPDGDTSDGATSHDSGAGEGAADDDAAQDEGGNGSSATSNGMDDGSPGEPECGNGIIDGEDVCDGTELGDTPSCVALGFERGQLACTANCGGYDLDDCGFFVCGNGQEEGEEDCDGTVGAATCATIGFDNGTLFCTTDCEYNDAGCGVCGNADIDPAEDCDTEKGLEESCQGLGFMTGSLACGDDCLFDMSGCSTCGNDVREADEDCDGPDVPGKTCAGEGFDSGSLGCTTSCDYDFTACGTCGNALADGDEACDGTDFGTDSCVTQGFDSGGLTCNAACDTIGTENCGTCGNNTIDGSETCDGGLLGGITCADLGLLGGTLGCNGACQYDYSGCDLQGIPFGDDGVYQGLSLDAGILPCDDINGSGTDLLLSDDDEATAALGFTFTFYGTAFTEVTIGSNGTLGFGTAFEPGLTNACLPDPFEDYLIAVYWDDLDPVDGVGGGVFHETIGPVGNRRFVVQWDTPHFFGDNNDLIRVQAMLHEGGAIDVCYVDTINAGNVDESGAGATAGIQSDTTSVEFSCNTPDLTDGLHLMYLPL